MVNWANNSFNKSHRLQTIKTTQLVGIFIVGSVKGLISLVLQHIEFWRCPLVQVYPGNWYIHGHCWTQQHRCHGCDYCGASIYKYYSIIYWVFTVPNSEFIEFHFILLVKLRERDIRGVWERNLLSSQMLSNIIYRRLGSIYFLVVFYSKF